MKILQAKNIKYFYLLGLLVLISYIISGRIESESIENLEIQSGVGYDLKKVVDGELEYCVPISFYTFSTDGTISSNVYTGKGTTIPKTREARQRKLNKRFIVGFEKVYVFSEASAREGLRAAIDILFRSQWINDNGYAFVCPGKAEDVMRMKIDEYESAADYLEGMIYSSKVHDFYTKEYSLISLVQTIDGEGKKAALPYVEVKDGQFQITGMAVFKRDKMVMKLDIEDTRIMNMMRNSKVSALIDIQDNSKKYASFDATAKRKIKCTKEGDKFKFVLNIDLSGNIINNQLYEGIIDTPQVQKEFEQEMAEKMKRKCEGFIKKMQEEYKMDVINISEAAISKYGRHTGIDWDEAVSKADIEVNVKVKVDQQLRGDY